MERTITSENCVDLAQELPFEAAVYLQQQSRAYRIIMEYCIQRGMDTEQGPRLKTIIDFLSQHIPDPRPRVIQAIHAREAGILSETNLKNLTDAGL